MKIFLSLTLLFLSCAAFAKTQEPPKPQWYTVEVIVFEHLTPQALSSEVWPAYPDEPSTQGAIELSLTDTFSDDLDQPQDYQLLTPSDFSMRSQARSLKRNSAYKILKHIAWRQIIHNKKSAQAIRLSGGQAFDGEGKWELDGTLTLTKTRFFNLQSNLVLHVPYQEVANLTGESGLFNTSSHLESFRLIQSRRLKENELHYIDHPLYGMLVKIIPVEIAEASSQKR